MDYFLIYLWTRLDSLNGLVTIVMFACAIILFLMFIAYVNGAVVYHVKSVFVTLIISSLLFIVIPSKLDALLIYFIPKVAKSEAIMDTTEIINKLPKVLKLEIEQYLEGKKKKD